MATKPYVTPLDEEITFEEVGLDAKALITKTDKKGIIQYASRAYIEMTKYSKLELKGSSHSIVRHPDMPETAFKEMWDTILQCRKWQGLVKNLRKDGKYYWVIVEIMAIDKDNNIIEYEPEKIEGFLAIRRQTGKLDKEKFEKDYKDLRKAELLKKKRRHTIKKWESELLEKYLEKDNNA